jgi:hypothetical protein
MRYLIPSLLFLANDEAISFLALLVLAIVFVCDVWKARGKYDAE